MIEPHFRFVKLKVNRIAQLMRAIIPQILLKLVVKRTKTINMEIKSNKWLIRTNKVKLISLYIRDIRQLWSNQLVKANKNEIMCKLSLIERNKYRILSS